MVLAPCTENFVTEAPAHESVQYLVFNDFEQRFSTSHPVDCYFVSELADIDTNSSTRSIFSALRGRNAHRADTHPSSQRRARRPRRRAARHRLAEFNLHTQGEREGASDIVTVVH